MDFNIPPPFPAYNNDELMQKEKDECDRDTESEETVPTMSSEECIKLATEHKEKGTAAFKSGQYQEALEAYNEGITALGKISVADTLLTALESNACMCCLKLSSWRDCISHATKVLNMDPSNNKALFRRAKACINVGDFEDAKKDLMVLIKLEPSSVEFRNMFQEASEGLKQKRSDHKAKYSQVFKKPLYRDREDAEKKRVKMEAEALEAEKREWEDEMASRAAEGEEEQVTFEDWKEAKAEKKKQEEKEREERRKSERLEREKNKPAAPAVVEEEEYTAEELKIMADMKNKGYCYFKNQALSEAEKAAKAKINRNKPEALSGDVSPIPEVPATAISSWNSAGTSYEEKSMLKWAKEMLTNLLTDAAEESNGANVEFNSVKSISGEAHIAVVRGTKRFLYDLELSVSGTYTKDAKKLHFTLSCQPSNVTSQSFEWFDDMSCNQPVAVPLCKKILEVCFNSFMEAFSKC